jgi:amino-acid N-acetyltransferase
VTDVVLRTATVEDAPRLHALVSAHREEGRLLPRELSELERHAGRFVVCEQRGQITACAELAPLSKTVAEVRSLVVSGNFRRAGLAARLIDELRERAQSKGFDTLCAFTHDARFFVRQGFSIVPHLWLPAKIATDCLSCPLFRRCEQHAMMLPLYAVPRYGTVNPAPQRVAVA